jgi:hypothetical protein
MARVALFQLRLEGQDQVGESAAFLLDDPGVAAMMGAAMVQRLAAATVGETLTYTAQVYELANPPEGG